MRIVHLNQNIGASSVPYRLMNALDRIGIESHIVTMISTVDSDHIHIVKPTFIFRVLRKFDSLIINIQSKKYPERKQTMPFSYYHVGMKLLNNDYVKNADIVIIHWVGEMFLSLRELRRIADSGKKIVMICHDNGHFTGGCHVRMGCDKYTKQCGECPQLGSTLKKDWSSKQLKRRIQTYKNIDVTVVSPSNWMDFNVCCSQAFKHKKHFIIPNPIDTDFFVDMDQDSVRRKYGVDENATVILFGAVKAVSTPYKGYSELIKALNGLPNICPDLEKIDAYVFGESGDCTRLNDKVTIHYLGYLNQDKMVEAYNLADVYVVPSLEDSFNNTVAESLSTKTPVVSFATGGIVDIIAHKECGYLAKYGDPVDLAEGIGWVLANKAGNRLGENGRKKIVENYSYDVVAKKYKRILEDNKL